WPARALGAGEAPRDRAGQALPVLLLLGELLPSLAGELIELGLAVVLGIAPFRLDQPLLLQPVQRRIERSLVHLQHVLRELLDPLGDSPSMHRVTGERAQDQEIQRALKQV